MNKKLINYVYLEEIKTNIDSPNKDDLILLFNKKIFKIIMKIENDDFEEYKEL